MSPTVFIIILVIVHVPRSHGRLWRRDRNPHWRRRRRRRSHRSRRRRHSLDQDRFSTAEALTLVTVGTIVTIAKSTDTEIVLLLLPEIQSSMVVQPGRQIGRLSARTSAALSVSCSSSSSPAAVHALVVDLEVLAGAGAGVAAEDVGVDGEVAGRLVVTSEIKTRIGHVWQY